MSNSLKSKLEAKFPSLNCVYQGRGQVNDTATDFAIGQRHDGSLVLCCGVRLVWRDFCDLSGTTDTGQDLEAQGPVFTVMGAYSGSTYNREFDEYYYSSYHESVMTVGENNWSRAKRVVFDITNFVFVGNAAGESAYVSNPNVLEITIENVELAFIRIDSYEETVDSLNNERSTKTTCQIVVEVKNHTEEKIVRIVNGICRLLTIARGIQINWITCKYYDSSNDEFFACLRSRITSPFQEYEIIESWHVDATEKFLTTCYSTYNQLNQHYVFSEFSHFLVDIHSTGFLQTRCLLLYAAIERLSRKVNNKEQINRKSVTLRKRLCDYVQCHSVPVFICPNCMNLCKKPDNQYLGSNEDKCSIQSGNRSCDIGFYIKCRNSLMHELKLYVSEPKENYTRILTLFHKMLLRSLDYNYKYIDHYDGWNLMGQSSVDLPLGPFELGP